MNGAGSHASRHWLGLDLGGTKILALRMNDAGERIDVQRVPTPAPFTPDVVTDQLIALARDSIARHGDVAGIGVGFPGLVDPSTGRVHASPILPGWDTFPLAERMRDALGAAVTVDNDATAAGYGEYVARGRPAGANMVLLTVGTGIGGALILGGKIYRGRSGSAGEFGNMSVDFEGALCWCGSRGCLNTIASGTALERREGTTSAERTASEEARSGDLRAVVRAAAAGDDGARRALERGATALGAGIANVLNILNPDLVVLAGGVIEIGASFVDRVRAEANQRAFAVPAAHAEIVTAVGGYEVGALGAAWLARDAQDEEA